MPGGLRPGNPQIQHDAGCCASPLQGSGVVHQLLRTLACRHIQDTHWTQLPPSIAPSTIKFQHERTQSPSGLQFHPPRHPITHATCSTHVQTVPSSARVHVPELQFCMAVPLAQAQRGTAYTTASWTCNLTTACWFVCMLTVQQLLCIPKHRLSLAADGDTGFAHHCTALATTLCLCGGICTKGACRLSTNPPLCGSCKT